MFVYNLLDKNFRNRFSVSHFKLVFPEDLFIFLKKMTLRKMTIDNSAKQVPRDPCYSRVGNETQPQNIPRERHRKQKTSQKKISKTKLVKYLEIFFEQSIVTSQNKHNEKLVEQTKIRAQETSEFKLNKQTNTFLFFPR